MRWWLVLALTGACAARQQSAREAEAVEQPPAPATVEHAAAIPADATELHIFELINSERRAGGLPPLVWDEQLAVVARIHAAEMRQQGVVTHESAVSGSVRDRVRASGVGASLVLENVGRSESVEKIHAELMRRGQHANIMSPVATRIAIGVAHGEGELFVTELFVRDQPPIDPARVARDVRKALGDGRDLHDDDDLAWIAADFARGLAAGRTREELWPQVRSRITSIDRRYERIEDLITVVADVKLLDLTQLTGQAELDVVGVGAAQGAHPHLGDGAVWIVVLNGRRLGH